MVQNGYYMPKGSKSVNKSEEKYHMRILSKTSIRKLNRRFEQYKTDFRPDPLKVRNDDRKSVIHFRYCKDDGSMLVLNTRNKWLLKRYRRFYPFY